MMKIHSVWVSQGDCTIIETNSGNPEGKIIIIDCGTTDTLLPIWVDSVKPTLLKIIEKNKVRADPNDLNSNLVKRTTIDYLFVTHPDLDHMNMIALILGLGEIKEVTNLFFGGARLSYKDIFWERAFTNPLLPYEAGSYTKKPTRDIPSSKIKNINNEKYEVGVKDENDKVINKWVNTAYELKSNFINSLENKDDEWAFPISDNFKLWILAVNYPVIYRGKKIKAEPDADYNSNSLIVLIQYLDFKAIFMGDATDGLQNKLLKKTDKDFIQSRVFKMAHHGAPAPKGFNEKFVNEAVKPEIVINSAGITHGHPSDEAIGQILDKIYMMDEHSLCSYNDLDMPAQKARFLHDMEETYNETIRSSDDATDASFNATTTFNTANLADDNEARKLEGSKANGAANMKATEAALKASDANTINSELFNNLTRDVLNNSEIATNAAIDAAEAAQNAFLDAKTTYEGFAEATPLYKDSIDQADIAARNYEDSALSYEMFLYNVVNYLNLYSDEMIQEAANLFKPGDKVGIIEVQNILNNIPAEQEDEDFLPDADSSKIIQEEINSIEQDASSAMEYANLAKDKHDEVRLATNSKDYQDAVNASQSAVNAVLKCAKASVKLSESCQKYDANDINSLKLIRIDEVAVATEREKAIEAMNEAKAQSDKIKKKGLNVKNLIQEVCQNVSVSIIKARSTEGISVAIVDATGAIEIEKIEKIEREELKRPRNNPERSLSNFYNTKNTHDGIYNTLASTKSTGYNKISGKRTRANLENAKKAGGAISELEGQTLIYTVEGGETPDLIVQQLIEKKVQTSTKTIYPTIKKKHRKDYLSSFQLNTEKTVQQALALQKKDKGYLDKNQWV